MDEPNGGYKALTLDYPDAELVFGFVCAVGTDYRPVVDYLKNLLRRARYDALELPISHVFSEIASNLGLSLDIPTDDEYQRIDAAMNAGNAIRERTKNLAS